MSADLTVTLAHDVDAIFEQRGVTIPAGTELPAQRTRFPGLSFYVLHEGRSYVLSYTDLVGIDPDDYELTDDDRDVIDATRT